jgi:hypothetical protein
LAQVEEDAAASEAAAAAVVNAANRGGDSINRKAGSNRPSSFTPSFSRNPFRLLAAFFSSYAIGSNPAGLIERYTLNLIAAGDRSTNAGSVAPPGHMRNPG